MIEPVGVIHDIGYQRYEGARLGRGYAVRSLFLHSLRAAFGIGRTAKAKVFPWLVVGIVGSVAVVLTAVRAATGEVALSYVGFPDAMSLLVILFCAVVAPELVSRELRTGVLSLYFSRPLRRTDYGLAKLAALVSAAWLLLAGPMLLMFLGGMFSVDGWSSAWDEIGDFGSGLAYAAVNATVIGVIAVLIASLVGRRAVAAGAIMAAFLVSTPVVGVLQEVGDQTQRELGALFSPVTLVGGVGDWLFDSGGQDVGDFGPLYGGVTLVLVAVCVGLLLLRYRKVRA